MVGTAGARRRGMMHHLLRKALLPALVVLSSGCQSRRAIETVKDPLSANLSISGKPISYLIQELGDPDEVLKPDTFGLKFDADIYNAVFVYRKWGVNVFVSQKGIVLGATAIGSKHLLYW
jgi:hypothetical protein